MSTSIAVCLLPAPEASRPLSLRWGGSREWATALALWLAGVSVGMALLLAAGWLGAARAQALTVPLQCRLRTGPWQPCRMEIQAVGERWWLQIGSERIEFRHGGDGSVRMQRAGGAWQPVDSSWQKDSSLCWDGVCTRGAIPLD